MSEKRFTLMLPNAIINDTIVRKSYYLSEKDDVEKLVGVLNEQQSIIQQKDKQLQKAKEYFMDYLSREMSANNFSEMWDLVIDDE